MQDKEIIRALRSIVGRYNLNQKEWQTIEFVISENNRLQAENEQLKEENKVYKNVNFLIASKRNVLEAENEKQQAEIERLNSNINGLTELVEEKHAIIADFNSDFSRARAEAVKEFGGKMIGRLVRNNDLSAENYSSLLRDVNLIAKEMGCE